MKSRKSLKFLFVVYLLVLIVVIKLFPLENSKMGLMSSIDNMMRQYQETVTQEPINNIVNKMYVTLIDKNNRIVATTDPKKQIDTVYKNNGKLSLTDNISVLLEIPETKENSIKDNIYYYYDLPNNIIPDETEVIDASKEPKDLISQSGIKAVGGIYQSNGGYQFKVKFSNTKDELDIKTTYQFNSKLKKEAAPNEGVNKVNLDFGIAGKVNVLVNIPITPVKPPTPEKKDLELTIDSRWQNNSYTDALWTINLNDNRDNPKMENGRTLDLYFPGNCSVSTNDSEKTNCMATDIYRTSVSKYSGKATGIKIYADNKELKLSQTGSAEYTYSFDGEPYYIKIDFSDLPLEIEPQKTASYLSRHIKLTFSSHDESYTSKNGVKNWRIELPASTYNVNKTSNPNIYDLTASLAGSTNEKENITVTKRNEKNSIKPQARLGVTGNENDSCLDYSNGCNDKNGGNEIKNKLLYSLRLDSSYNLGNYLELTVNPNYQNEAGLYYYADACAFSTGYHCYSRSSITNVIKNIKVDGQEIDWEKGYQDYKTNDNGARVYDYDPAIKAMLTQLINNEIEYPYLIYRSVSSYNDKHYYIVTTPEAFGLVGFNSGNRGVSSLLSETNTLKPAQWKIYLFNTSGKEIQMNYFSNLGRVNIDSDALYKGNKPILSKITVKNDLGSYDTNATYYVRPSKEVITQTPIYHTNNLISWNYDVNWSQFLKPKDASQIVSGLYGMMMTYGIFDEHMNTFTDPSVAISSGIVPNDLVPSTTRTEIFDYSNNIWNGVNSSPSTVSSFSHVSGLGSSGINIKPNLNEFSYYNYKYQHNYAGQYGGLNTNNVKLNGENYTSRFRFFTYYTGKLSNPFKRYIANKNEMIFSNSDSLFLPFGGRSAPEDDVHLKSIGIAPVPYFNDSAVKTNITSTNDKDELVTNQTWNIRANTMTSYDYPHYGTSYYYNGHIDISDDMSNSTIFTKKSSSSTDYNIGDTAVDGANNKDDYEELQLEGLNVGQFTKLDSVTVNYSGPGVNYNGSHLETVELNTSDIEDGKLVVNRGDVTITLTYNGNMKEGFNVALDNLTEAAVVDVTYNTSFDHKAFADSLVNNGQEPADGYKVVFKNNAYLPNTDIKAKPAESEVKINTYLEVNKKVEDIKDIDNGNISKKYTVNTTTGYSSVPYVNVSDSVRRYTMIDKDANVLIPYLDNSDAVKALASSINLKDIVITKINSDQDNSETIIYEDGQFIEGWENSKFILSSSNEKGKLYDAHFETSKGRILPGTTFKIEYVLDVDMEHELEEGTTFRESDYYPEPAQRLYIDTIVNSNIEAQQVSVTETLNSTDVGRKIVGINRVAALNMDDNLSINGGAASTYLQLPEAVKTLLSQKGTEENWEYTYRTGTIGKTNKVTAQITDSPTYSIENDIPEENKNKFSELLKKHQQFRKIKLIYLDENDKETEVIKVDGLLDQKVSNKVNDANYTLSLASNNDLILNIKDMPFNTKVTTNYILDLDIDAFKEEAKDQGIFNEKYEVIGDEENGLIIKVKNSLLDDLKSLTEEWGSKAIITEASINKRVKAEDEAKDITTWEATVSTGTSNLENITIKDIVKVLTEDDKLKTNIYIDDIIIKLDEKEVYNSTKENPYSDGINESNISINNKNNLQLDVNINNTEKNKIIGNNQVINIEYKTKVDKEKYGLLGGKNKAEYTLENEAQLFSKNKELDKATATTKKYTVDVPVTVNKTFVGNNENLEEAKFKITTNTSDMSRLNYTIGDNLESEKKKYLSINNMVVKENDKVIYESGKSLPTNMHIYKKGTTEEFKFDSIGSTDFDIAFDTLKSQTKIEVEYSVKIDRNKYLQDNNDTDEKITSINNVEVKAQDGASAKSKVEGEIMVSSKFTKAGIKKGLSSNSLPLLEWSINANLLTEYTKEQLKNAEIEISDKLNAALKYYENSLEIYNVVTTTKGNKRGSKLGSEEYTFTIENNTIKVKLLNPSVNNNIEIVFKTESLASISELENEAILTINGKQDRIKSENLENIITTNTSGTVTSTKVGTYAIIGKKELDNKPSAVGFKFKIKEIDAKGKVIKNGYQKEIENREDGIIKFEGIRFKKAGTYYYEISEEIDEKSKKYKYDETKYRIKIEVEKRDNAYVVIKEEIESPKKEEEIIFKNKTKKNQVQAELDEVPETLDKIGKYMIMFIMAILCLITIRIYRKRLNKNV